MIKTGSLILTLLLMGCGGGAGGESPADKSPSTKGQEVVDKKEDKKPLSTDENGKVTTIKLSGSAESVAVSKDALFVAEGEDGIEVHKIGYNASVSSEFVAKIDGINARSVSLSADGKKLHVINEEGFVNIINISNISKPVKERITTQSEIKKETITKDGNYKFVPKNDKGVAIYDVSNPSSESLVTTFNKSSAYDIVLADRDTKLLLAAGHGGINLLDVTDPHNPNLSANFSLDGNIRGISLNEEQGLLFVANGDSGVLVYSLNVLLDKITKAK